MKLFFHNNYKSWLDTKRTTSIINLLNKQYSDFIKWRHKYIIELNKNDKKGNDINRPAWYTISTTTSSLNYRLTFGFYKLGCAYWRDDKNFLGCLICGYGSTTVQNNNITIDNLLNQYKFAINWAKNNNFKFDVIELLSDGSFFNFKNEWPVNFIPILLENIKKEKEVKRVLVESRPEYISHKKINFVLSNLRKDQTIEIGIGLESSDDFVREVCIRKGFDKKELENALDIISNFERCNVLVYSLIKPPFLTELESIVDIVKTSNYLSELQKKNKIKIIHKLEPAVIAQGTLIEYLYNQNNYDVLNYWGVVEILCRLHLENNNIETRIGAREDMDVVIKVPGIYSSDGTFNQYDFICYDTVQTYNAGQDFIRFISNIQLIVDNDKSLYKWISENNISNSAILTCLNKYKSEIKSYRKTEIQVLHELFIKEIFKILDYLEFDNRSHEFAHSFRKMNINNIEKGKLLLQEFILNQFSNIEDVSILVHDFFFEDDNIKLLRIMFSIKYFKLNKLYDVWIGIPSRNID